MGDQGRRGVIRGCEKEGGVTERESKRGDGVTIKSERET